MGFLSPFLLASVMAMAVPLWLHLRRKRRQTPVEFPSLRYLKMAAARMKRQARVEDPWLLMMRLLLLALLALAFARPVLRMEGGWLGSGRSVESVVVIDATASMGWRGETGTRIDAAKRMAREWINGLDHTDEVALWVLTDRLEKPVPVPIVDRDFLFKQLDAVVASDASSSLAPVFTAAKQWAEIRGTGRKELVVVTDNQKAAWDWPAEGFFSRSWDRGALGLVVLTPDSVRAPNSDVKSVEWDAGSVREGVLLTGVARVENHGDAAVTDLLECKVGGATVFRKPVEIAAGGSVDVPLSLAVPTVDGPVLTGTIALAGDALACDDTWNFALPVRHPSRSLVIERESGATGLTRPSFFLSKALAAGGSGKATVVTSGAWMKQTAENTDALWFTGGPLTETNVWTKAVAFANAGGTVVLAGDSQPGQLPADWPVTSGGESNLPAGRMATRVLAPGHPLFDGVWSEQTPFPPLPQRIARSCAPADGAKVLISLAGSYPLLVEKPCGNGRMFWLNASVDRTWGDLPLSPAFVAVVQQLARAKELALQTETIAWAGDEWPDIGKFSIAASWPKDENTGRSDRMMRAGVFDAVSGDGKPLWRCAVNVRRAESDLRPVEAAKLEAMLPGKVVTGRKGVDEWRDEVRREIPLWPWILSAAALVFLAEGWMSARAARLRASAAGGGLPKWMEGRLSA